MLRADLYVKYSGDTQLVAPTASYNFDTQRQYCKAAQDAVDSQVIGDTIIGNTPGQISLLIPSAKGLRLLLADYQSVRLRQQSIRLGLQGHQRRHHTDLG